MNAYSGSLFESRTWLPPALSDIELLRAVKLNAGKFPSSEEERYVIGLNLPLSQQQRLFLEEQAVCVLNICD